MKNILALLLITALFACKKQTSELSIRGNNSKSTVSIISTVTAWQVAQTYYRKITFSTQIDTATVKYLTVNKSLVEISRLSNLKPSDVITVTDQQACLCDIYYMFIAINKNNTQDTLGIFKTSY